VCSTPYYTYLRVDCASPVLTLHIDSYGVGTSTATLQYWLPGATASSGQTNAMTTIASVGSVGGYVDGTVSAPSSEFSGSFHACRGPDGQDVGH
jgi:hypothetical protein